MGSVCTVVFCTTSWIGGKVVGMCGYIMGLLHKIV